MDIKLIKGKDIDKVKWNSCVHYAGNGNIFGYKWFLDQVAKDWDALVEGDYESVFPLPYREGKWRGPSLKQPNLMRELGLYSIHVLSRKRMLSFLNEIPADYKRVDLVINEQNPPLPESGFTFLEETNYQLPMPKTYEDAAGTFDSAYFLALQKATDADLLPMSGLSPEVLIDFWRKEQSNYSGKTNDSHALLRIMYNTLHRGWGFASGVQDREGNILAANFFIYSHGKVLSLMPTESPKGKEKGALVFLFDMLLRSHVGRTIILDFNSDDEDGVGAMIGGTANQYFRVQRKSRSIF